MERISDEQIKQRIEVSDAIHDDALAAMLRELVRLREGWVSAENPLTLPPPNKKVLVFTSAGLFVDSVNKHDGIWEGGDDYCITHWRELPAPPRPFTSQEVYEARICSRCDHSHASHNDGHPHLGCDVPSEQGAPCGCEKFTSQEVFEGIPELVAKAEEMEKQGVVDVPKVGE